MDALWRVLGGVLAAVLLAGGAWAQAREALIVANRDYATAVGPLANTHEDADLVAAALQAAGFRVRVVKEASRLTVLSEIRDHAGRLAAGGQGAIGLFYYSGHGAAEELSGRNYLIPIDVASTADAQLWDASVDVADIQRRLAQAAPGANHFIIFDACRNELRLPSRDASRGFVPVAQMGGMFVSFSTAPGLRASDGDPDEVGGPFARAFVEELGQELSRGGAGRDATAFFSDVKFNVRDRTGGGQLPWQVDGLAVRVYPFGEPGEAPPPTAAAPAPDAPERLAYELAETACDYAAFVEAYPASVLAPLARARAVGCGADAASPPGPAAPAAPSQDALVREAQELLAAMGYDPGPADGAAGTRTGDAVAAFRAATGLGSGRAVDANLVAALNLFQAQGHRAPARAVTPAAPPAIVDAPQGGLAAGSTARGAGESFRDCAACPEMVVVPAGSFTMGSPAGEAGRGDDEGPQRTVRIGAFAAGKFEVTWAEWAAFAQATGRADGGNCYVDLDGDGSWSQEASGTWRNTGFSQTDMHPVVCVSWDDAQAYVRWLSQQTGEDYRLLTEAEWEYGARAGTTSAYHFGSNASALCGYGNVADRTAKRSYASWTVADCDDGYRNTAPVGSFSGNDFGLQDMHGNVWEWVQDCYADSYSGAPTDGSAVSVGSCSSRVLRGGSWNSVPRILRAAYRFRSGPSGRFNYSGFRVARTL